MHQTCNSEGRQHSQAWQMQCLVYEAEHSICALIQLMPDLYSCCISLGVELIPLVASSFMWCKAVAQ